MFPQKRNFKAIPSQIGHVDVYSQVHSAPVTCMATDASGGLVATASADSTARIWDAAGAFCTHVFGPHRCQSARPCQYKLVPAGLGGSAALLPTV